ncbi:UDP-N-acetylglucosamine 2-epimerase [Oribacterium sp. P6A1]|uniref:UDP-N-acetylglucosamine 2-epimerase n=1 Tax=Oribacterium sp. P6A1 TaxID=1410612 RepID=UPI000565E292|nr:UDP-N-acetylglucosamine 2-epimerase [Oribacterium sp. P6A1]
MKKIKICIVTATRAEFGLLRPIIEKMKSVEEFEIIIVATGMHLSPEFGLTYKEIEECGFTVDKKIEMQLSSDSTVSVAKTMGLTMISFADYFDEEKPDYVIVTADRYEAMAVASTAMVMRIPIIHLFGGETTEGAIDESIRHSISKMSYLHFTTLEEYRKRVIQLGEDPERVFAVGGTGSENIRNLKLLSLEQLEAQLDFDLTGDYAVVTLHPVTLENNSAEKQVRELLLACDKHPEIKYIFTKANSDADGRIINNALIQYCKEHKNAKVYDSLGYMRYLSAVKYSAFVLGNSSSGIMEVPSFGVPTVDIGDRERGRLRAASVINCAPNHESIVEAMDKALDSEFRNFCRTVDNPYSGKNTSSEIVRIIKEHVIKSDVDLKKKFYDVDFEVKR